jgi:hypothetical protein
MFTLETKYRGNGGTWKKHLVTMDGNHIHIKILLKYEKKRRR